MMKRMCDCGCDHAITDYDAGQTPIIIQRGELLLEVRVLPGPAGERPNVRPVCARAAVSEGVVLFPRAESIVDPAAEDPVTLPPSVLGGQPRREQVEPEVEVPAAGASVVAPAGVGAPASANGHANGNGKAASNGNGNGKGSSDGKLPVVRPLKTAWSRRG